MGYETCFILILLSFQFLMGAATIPLASWSSQAHRNILFHQYEMVLKYLVQTLKVSLIYIY